MKKIAKKSKKKLTRGSTKATIGVIDRECIKRLRTCRGLTMREAAKLAKFSTHNQWFNLEHRAKDANVSTLMRVASVLECTVDYLLKRSK